MVTLNPITDWWGNVIRYEEVPTGADPVEPTPQNVANHTPETETYHLTRGGIPSPNNQEHPEAQAKYPPGVSPIPSKR